MRGRGGLAACALCALAVMGVGVVGLRPAGAAPAGFLDDCNRSAGTLDNSDGCINAVLGAIDHARSAEGLGALALPTDYATESPEAQLLAIVDQERSDRGLATFAGTTAELDQSAQTGAGQAADPAVSAPSYSNGAWEENATEAGAVSQALEADYYWMYDDGWDGSRANSFNVDCASADDPACWNHRRALLATYHRGQTLTMGAAVSPGGAGGYPSWTTLLAGTDGAPASYVATRQPAATTTAAASTGSASCDGAAPTGPVSRIAGADRDATAILTSRTLYGASGSAAAVVLASDATFADALAGGPLAAGLHGPLLLTHPDGLSSDVEHEITRVLPTGKTVYVLGGSLALDPSIDDQLHGDGYTVRRVAGSDRFETAVDVAALGTSPSAIIEVTGDDFADALAAAPAAAAQQAALLLTDGARQASATASYIAEHPVPRFAVGGPAHAADPDATAIVGADRVATALAVTQSFVTHPTSLAFAIGDTYPDALAGGAAAASTGGGLLLVPRCGPLPSDVQTYLGSVAGGVGNAWLFGGPLAVSNNVLAQLDQSLGHATN